MLILKVLGIITKIFTLFMVLGLHGYTSVKVPPEELGKINF